MFTPIDEHMSMSRDERRSHLLLDEPCIFIGGYDSREYRGLLAHYLMTEIPTGKRGKFALCHACHNHHCSNVRHLYWGTVADNVADMFDAGTITRSTRKPKKSRAEIDRAHEELLTKLDAMERTKWGWISRASRELGVTHTHIRRLERELASRAGIEPA